MDGWMTGWMWISTNKGMGELMDGSVNRWMSERMGYMDITTDGYVNR